MHDSAKLTLQVARQLLTIQHHEERLAYAHFL